MACATLALAGEFCGAMSVGDLRCEYRSSPLGIDITQPRLSWIPQSGLRSDKQTAYHLLVASSAALLNANTGDLWDSGVVPGAEAQIPYGGQSLHTAQQVFWKVQVWDKAGTSSAWSSNTTWTTGLMNTNDWVGVWITPSTAATDTGSSLLLKSFSVGAGLQRALVYICGLGQYELTVNGNKIGQNILAPGWSKFDKTCLYDTYDITSQISAGTNAIGVFLGNGMYNIPNSSRYAKFTGSFGPRKVIAQIVLQYGTGPSQIIATDGTWRWHSGPVTFNTIYGGEDYDARLEIANWGKAVFNDSGWPQVSVVSGPGGALRGTTYGGLSVIPQGVFAPVNSWAIGTGSTVYDFAQNASQIPTISVSGPAGSTVTLSPSELINSNHTLQQIVAPTYMTYTLKGSGTETFKPRFYYIGYRYLRVDLRDPSGGTTGTLPTMTTLTSTILSSAADSVGNFACSKALFNRIRANVLWAQRNNSISIFTDCPTREKLGWLEQDYLNGPSLRYERSLNALFTGMVNDMADSQLASGLVPDIAPEYTVFSGGYRDSPEWGSAVVQIPWQQYQFAGDVNLLRQYYGTMKAYVDYLTSQASGNTLNYGLGDWFDLGPSPLGQAQSTPVGLTASCTYYLDALALSQIATVLGKESDASAYSLLAGNIAAAFNNRYYNASGYYATNSNTADAMALAAGLVVSNNVPKVVNALAASLGAHQYAWTSGDIGYRYLLRALADNGRSDLVFQMLNRSNAPGYGYILAQGATSLTEGWDATYSQDHFMLGQALEWFYHDLAGIQSDPSVPAFRKIIIKPAVVGDVTWVNASYNSIGGQVSNYWCLNGNLLSLSTTIPPGATGVVYVPTLGTAASLLRITESGTTIWQNGASAGVVPGVEFDHVEGSIPSPQAYVAFAVDSGSYQFGAQLFLPPTGLGASVGVGRTTLTWNAQAGAGGYNVKRSLVSGGGYVLIASNINATTYTDLAVSNNVNYYYVVSAVDGGVESDNSAEVNACPGYVADFGFELPSVTTYQYNPTGGSWGFTASSGGSNGSGISGNGTPFTAGNPNAPEGRQVGVLQGISSITQTATGLVPSATYQVTFAAAQRNNLYGGQAGQTWNLLVDGTVIGSFAPLESASNYVDYSCKFVASASSQALAFVGTDLNGGDNTVFLDNVRIAPAPSSLPPKLGWQVASNAVLLNWPSDHVGWRLQSQTNALGAGMGTNWTDVAGASTTNRLSFPTTAQAGSVFLRLAFP